MRRTALVVAGLVLATSTAAEARPADVVITNSAANPGVVALAPSGNDVDVTSSAASPVYSREAPALFGDALQLNASNGGAACKPIKLVTGRAARLEAVIVSAASSAQPRAWLEMWGETAAQTQGLAAELDIPLRSAAGTFHNWSGQLQGGIPVLGGGVFAADGVPAEVAGCVRAPAGTTVSAHVLFSGVYLS